MALVVLVQFPKCSCRTTGRVKCETGHFIFASLVRVSAKRAITAAFQGLSRWRGWRKAEAQSTVCGQQEHSWERCSFPSQLSTRQLLKVDTLVNGEASRPTVFFLPSLVFFLVSSFSFVDASLFRSLAVAVSAVPFSPSQLSVREKVVCLHHTYAHIRTHLGGRLLFSFHLAACSFVDSVR